MSMAQWGLVRQFSSHFPPLSLFLRWSRSAPLADTHSRCPRATQVQSIPWHFRRTPTSQHLRCDTLHRHQHMPGVTPVLGLGLWHRQFVYRGHSHKLQGSGLENERNHQSSATSLSTKRLNRWQVEVSDSNSLSVFMSQNGLSGDRYGERIGFPDYPTKRLFG